MQSLGIYLFLFLAFASYADLACVTSDKLEWDAGLYPSISYYIYSGGETCFTGHMCSWFFRINSLNSSVDLSLAVNFNPPLFFFLSTNSYSMKGDGQLTIDIPPPKEDQIGRYTLELVAKGQNISFSGCADFEIRKPPTYNVTRYNSTATDNANILSYMDSFWTVVNNQNIPNWCNQSYSFGTVLDYSQFDPIKTFVATTRMNITTVECLHGVASRYKDSVMNQEFKLMGIGNQMELFWTDGYQLYQRLYNSSYDFVPLIDEWIPVFENYKEGGISTSGGGLFLHTRYVDALINRMARSGELDTRLIRAVHFLMSTMLNFRSWVVAPEQSYYSNGFNEGGYAMRTLVTWGLLTNDNRVPYVLKEFAEFAKLWITNDYQMLFSLNTTDFNPESSNVMAMGFAAYWRYNGDRENFDLAMNLINASMVLGPNFVYSFSGKHIDNYVTRNYDAFMWLLDPSVIMVQSKIPFVFPDIVIPSNNTVVLPNQTIVVTTTTTILGNLVLSDLSSLLLTYGSVLNISGCATLSGTLVLQVKDGQVILNDTLLLAYACRDGEFDQLVLQGDVDPCKEYQLSYTPTSMSIIIGKSNLCATAPSGPTADKFPDWAIAVIVVGGLGICGAIIGIVLHFKKVEAKKKHNRLSRKISMTQKNLAEA